MPIDRIPNARPKIRGAMETAYSERGLGKSFLWYCYSPKSDADCALRSNLEYCHFLQVEADSSIVSVDYAPKAFITRAAGEHIASVVDAVIKRTTGETIWREVKTEKALAVGADARAELQVLAQSRMSGRLGDRHEVLTEKQLLTNPMLLRNWHQALAWIAQVRGIPLEHEVDQIHGFIERRGTVHFAELLELDGSRSPAIYGAAALRAVQTGAIRSDLDARPFCKYTRLSPTVP